MDPRLAPLAALFDLNTDLVLNCLDGIGSDEARHQPAPGQNSISFLVAHITDSRHYLASWLGHPGTNPLSTVLADANGIDDVHALPPIDALRTWWEEVSTHLAGAFEAAPAELLNDSSPARFPLSDSSRLGAIAFLAQHESYHVGQLGWLRRMQGKPGMKYSRR
jgi:uncharacterized damage-inducible protein DinB